jgi:hypothetical protein
MVKLHPGKWLDCIGRVWSVFHTGIETGFPFFGHARNANGGGLAMEAWTEEGVAQSGLDSYALIKESREPRVVYVEFTPKGTLDSTRTQETYDLMEPEHKAAMVKFVEELP